MIVSPSTLPLALLSVASQPHYRACTSRYPSAIEGGSPAGCNCMYENGQSEISVDFGPQRANLALLYRQDEASHQVPTGGSRSSAAGLCTATMGISG